MWLNWSVATINAMLQLSDISRYGKVHEHLAQKRKVSLNSFDSGFHGFVVLFGNAKDVLS